MRHQDGQQRKRKGHPGQKQLRTPQADGEDVEIPVEVEERKIVREVVLHVRPDQRGREHREHQQQYIQPEPVFRASTRKQDGTFKPRRLEIGYTWSVRALDQIFRKHKAHRSPFAASNGAYSPLLL
jgi:hypothetical protein